MDQYKQINQELVESNSELKTLLIARQRELIRLQGDLLDQRRIHAELKTKVQNMLGSHFRMLHSSLMEMNPGENVLQLLDYDNDDPLGRRSRSSNLGSDNYSAHTTTSTSVRRSSCAFEEFQQRRSNVYVSPTRRRSSGSLSAETEAEAVAPIVSPSREIPRYAEADEGLHSIRETDERDEQEREESERMKQVEIVDPEIMEQMGVMEVEQQVEAPQAQKYVGVTQRRGEKAQILTQSVQSQAKTKQTQTKFSESLPSPTQHHTLRSKRRNILIYHTSPLRDTTNHSAAISEGRATAFAESLASVAKGVPTKEGNISSDAAVDSPPLIIIRRRAKKAKARKELKAIEPVASKLRKELSDIEPVASKVHKEFSDIEPVRRSTRQKDKTIASTSITSVNSTHKELTTNDSVSMAMSELTIGNFIGATSSTPRSLSDTKIDIDMPTENIPIRPSRRCAPKNLIEPSLHNKLRNESSAKRKKKK